METVTLLENRMVVNRPMPPCPECGGTGYTTIETRESMTLCGDKYPITYQIIGYKTVKCWRCGGSKRVERL